MRRDRGDARGQQRRDGTRKRGGVGAGPWAGQFTFNTDTNNPFDTNYSYANALIGSFQNYTEIDAFSEVKGKRYISEFYVQDNWRVKRNFTIDAGVRFYYLQPTRSAGDDVAQFIPNQFSASAAPSAARRCRMCRP